MAEIDTDAHFDIAICGGGLVGLTLANALGRSNFKIAVIDGQARPTFSEQKAPKQKAAEYQAVTLDGCKLASGFAPRVSAINVASMKILENIGVWQDIKRMLAFKQMSVRDTSGSANIKFSAEDIQLDSLGYIVENREILVALANKLKTHENISVFWDTKLNGIDDTPQTTDTAQATDKTHTYRLSIGNQTIYCDLLVGADGGNSRVRELSGIKTLRWSYDQEALVTTIKTEYPHEKIARQWFTSEGPLAFLPLAEPNLCSIVWSLNDVSEHKASNLREFCARLTEASEGELGNIIGADQRFSFPLTQQHAFSYVKENLALIGDAAHTIHPLAGQGANLGFADASALASELMQAKFSEKGIGDLALLRRYELARKPHNLLMTSVMEALKRLYTSGDPGINWIRNTAMKIANDNDLLKNMMARLASGL
ncbi:MAG: UbiH/UbiF/VisC/COQ6 family ubiquinone biosynthesis hydroxylase [Pseudomonadales bacterium]|nr:UbiH/UbiF/VisC/COQ6 family ubiquinone biosynthesis hydroxylase [Pseudomonadales bacterium]